MKWILTVLFNLFTLLVLAQTPEANLRRLNIQLPPISQPIANYVRAVQTGNLVFLSGHAPKRNDGSLITGKVGTDLSIEQGYEAAKITTLNLLATLQETIGSLDRVRRIVKVTGYVNCGPDFTKHPQVINGCSDLLISVFGERGKHARSAMAMVSLSNNMAVEIEMIVEVAPE